MAKDENEIAQTQKEFATGKDPVIEQVHIGTDGDTSHSAGDETSETSDRQQTDSSMMEQDGPGFETTLPPVTVLGPPSDVLANPDLLPFWEDMQDGWDSAEAGMPPTSPQSDAFWTGWLAFVHRYDNDGPAVDVAPEHFVPFDDPATRMWLEYLQNDHDDHMEGEKEVFD